MAAERIRTKKLLAEVTKDLTPEQINGKSFSVFKKIVKETNLLYIQMIAYKDKKKCFTLELNVHGLYRETVFSLPEQKSYNLEHYIGP